MHGRAYYLTTLDAWQHRATSFATSHYVAARGSTILALVEADEAVHEALAHDPDWEALPHPLSQKPISDLAAESLAAFDVAAGATTFDAAEAAARAHPILRYRVF